MTPREYVRQIERLADRRAYAEMLELAERVGPELADRLTAEQVRVLRVRLKHAEMALAATPAQATGRAVER